MEIYAIKETKVTSDFLFIPNQIIIILQVHQYCIQKPQLYYPLHTRSTIKIPMNQYDINN